MDSDEEETTFGQGLEFRFQREGLGETVKIQPLEILSSYKPGKMKEQGQSGAGATSILIEEQRSWGGGGDPPTPSHSSARRAA